MKKTFFAVLAGVMIVTPALAAGKSGVASVVHNAVGLANSIVGGGGTAVGGGSTSLGGGASVSGGPINISTGLGIGIPPAPGALNSSSTNGFYLGAQSDGNGFVSLQITKTLFRF
ncbi:MAG: hypothetical protein WA138_10635 [Parvibaculum sp.]